MFNNNETTINDDSRMEKAMVSRGTRMGEQVVEHSKANISVMVCGSADGELFPPFVHCKSEHLYNGWTIGGPKERFIPTINLAGLTSKRLNSDSIRSSSPLSKTLLGKGSLRMII